jgi:hypothetical protein
MIGRNFSIYLTLVGMNERRSLLEWVSDAVATIGLVIFLWGTIFRDRGLAFGYGYEDAAIFLTGGALFAGGAAASSWYKKRRLAASIDAAQRGDRAN